jgi:cytochrome c peroxidase
MNKQLSTIRNSFLPGLIILCLLSACGDDEPQVAYDPTPYHLEVGNLPAPQLPADNKLTNAGVQLGRMLFYEKAMSRDGSISCADCHQQKDMFSDIRQFSEGVDGKVGGRQAMAAFNLAWHSRGLFWDGRVATLREQALRPIQDSLEMNESLENVVGKLSAMPIYQDQFTRAFGTPDITSARIGLAIEQFEITIVSNQSKYDHYEQGHATLSDAEERGRQLFFANADPGAGVKGGECVHCHGGPNFANDFFVNNGLDRDVDFTDLGRFNVTGLPTDRAVFKVPSLRNIALTPPYMHDGRFNTLEEVIDHYNSGVKNSSTVHHTMEHNLQHGGLLLNAQEKADLVAFLHTLTDETLKTDERYASPF